MVLNGFRPSTKTNSTFPFFVQVIWRFFMVSVAESVSVARFAFGAARGALRAGLPRRGGPEVRRPQAGRPARPFFFSEGLALRFFLKGNPERLKTRWRNCWGVKRDKSHKAQSFPNHPHVVVAFDGITGSEKRKPHSAPGCIIGSACPRPLDHERRTEVRTPSKGGQNI